MVLPGDFLLSLVPPTASRRAQPGRPRSASPPHWFWGGRSLLSQLAPPSTDTAGAVGCCPWKSFVVYCRLSAAAKRFSRRQTPPSGGTAACAPHRAPSDTPAAPDDVGGTTPCGIAPRRGKETAGEDAMASVHRSDGGTDPKTPRGPCCVVAVEICRLGSRSPPQHNVKWLQDGLSATYICCL